MCLNSLWICGTVYIKPKMEPAVYIRFIPVCEHSFPQRCVAPPSQPWRASHCHLLPAGRDQRPLAQLVCSPAEKASRSWETGRPCAWALETGQLTSIKPSALVWTSGSRLNCHASPVLPVYFNLSATVLPVCISNLKVIIGLWNFQ